MSCFGDLIYAYGDIDIIVENPRFDPWELFSCRPTTKNSFLNAKISFEIAIYKLSIDGYNSKRSVIPICIDL